MIVNRDKITKTSKAKLGIPEFPKASRMSFYKPSAMQKRARILGNIVGVALLAAFIFGAAYLAYTILFVSKNIAERRLAEPAQSENAQNAQTANEGGNVEIIYKPADNQ